MKRWIGILIFAGLLTGCMEAGGKRTFDSQYFDYFDTFTSFTVCAEDEEQFQEYEELFQSELKRYHQLFDIYESYSGINNIKTINENAGAAPVQVEDEIIELLEFAGKEYEKTDGKVNVAMGSVLSVWHGYRQKGVESPTDARIPDRQELEKAAGHTDMEKVVIDRQKGTVYLSDPDMSLDVGAVAKGFASQKICDKLKAAGVTSALINIGGNVQTIGGKENKKPWRVGIQNPELSGAQPYLHALNLQDMALVTSGTYQRYYEVDGARYHHIIDPETLMPSRGYESVTVLCPDAGMADALSTALFNMSFEEGQKMINSMAGTEAFWVFEDGSQAYSSGFESYVEE